MRHRILHTLYNLSSHPAITRRLLDTSCIQDLNLANEQNFVSERYSVIRRLIGDIWSITTFSVWGTQRLSFSESIQATSIDWQWFQVEWAASRRHYPRIHCKEILENINLDAKSMTVKRPNFIGIHRNWISDNATKIHHEGRTTFDEPYSEHM